MTLLPTKADIMSEKKFPDLGRIIKLSQSSARYPLVSGEEGFISQYKSKSLRNVIRREI